MSRGGQDDKRENKLLCPHKSFPFNSFVNTNKKA